MNHELPQAVEMEKSVLAAMLLRDGLVIPKVTSIISADDLYREEHRIIFRAIVKLYQQGIAPNILSLMDELEKTNAFNKIDRILVLSLADAGYITAYAEIHSKVIKEKSELRKIIYFAEQLIETAQRSITPIQDIVASADEFFHNLKSDTPTVSFDCQNFFAKNFFPEVEKLKNYFNRSSGFLNLDKKQISVLVFTSSAQLLPLVKLLSVGNFSNNLQHKVKTVSSVPMKCLLLNFFPSLSLADFLSTTEKLH